MGAAAREPVVVTARGDTRRLEQVVEVRRADIGRIGAADPERIDDLPVESDLPGIDRIEGRILRIAIRQIGREVLESRHVLEQRNVQFQRAFVDVVIDIDGSHGVLNPAQRCGVSGGQTHAQARAVDEVGGQEVAFHHVRLPARIDRQVGGDFARGKTEAPKTAANGGADVVQILRQVPRRLDSKVVIGRRRNATWSRDVRRNAAGIKSGKLRLCRDPAPDGAAVIDRIQRGQVLGVVGVVGIGDRELAGAVVEEHFPGEAA